MTATDHLNTFNISIEEARTFIITHINNPSVILQTCLAYGVTNQMLAEIYGGISKQDVIEFFNNVGLNSLELDATQTNPEEFSTQDLDVDAASIQSLNSPNVISLASGDYWSDTNLTYSFNTSFPNYYYSELSSAYLSSGPQGGWKALSAAAQTASKQVLNDVSNLTLLQFTEVSSTQGDINFNSLTFSNATDGFAYYPSTQPIGGEIFLNNTYQTEEDYQKGGTAYNTLAHELGHALGLKHSFESPNPLSSNFENSDYSIMSYTDVRELVPMFSYDPSTFRINVVYSQSALKDSFSVLDVAALQAIYGVNSSYATGNNTYSLSFDQKKYLTIWDAGGTDTINLADTTGNSSIDLRPGQLSSVDVRSINQQVSDTLEWLTTQNAPDYSDFVNEVFNDNGRSFYTGENSLSIAFGVWIENVTTGSGNDIVRDNAVDNRIDTGSGNDIIQLYEGGYDQVNGGDGLDSIYLDKPSSSVSYVKSDSGYTLIGDHFSAEIIGIETLVFNDNSSITLA
ncbi:M10 family metallopeptidase [Marinomonas algicola]|uniref:M10 family metallopeptidase n=1 Tax=Marinomonas algicola TaxID=2773454 RepID=UPI00174B0C46|nr:M10 family metallopeptidase [Marinomonas algicola]